MEKLGIIALLIIAVTVLYRENRELRKALQDAVLSIERFPEALDRLRETIRQSQD